MTLTGRTRRLVYLVHRWTGIAGCLLMLLWFVSGVVMMYVGYPKLTPAERLGALPALSAVAAAPVPATAGDPWTGDTSLSSVRGEPAYVLRPAGQPPRMVSAASGLPLAAPVTKEQALREAQSFFAGAPVAHEGLVHEDRWTHSRSLDPHRPLHRITAGDAERTTLYVSSLTGQVLLDAPLSEQRWNYIGAWLHWLYLFRDDSVDPTWTWLVIVLSAVGTVTALSGIVVGLWRWRFTGRYKSGSHSPYREPWMKWHHVIGLLFSAFVFTWIFSGLMSMNPLDVFSARHGRPDVTAYQAGVSAQPGTGSAAMHAREEPIAAGMGTGSGPPKANGGGALAKPAHVIAALHDAGFVPVELAWKRLDGIPYVLAHDGHAHTRIVRVDGHTGALSVEAQWGAATVLRAARRLFAAPIVEHDLIEEYDIHYYQRHAAAMNGARQHHLPALRIRYADPDDTLVYIDLPTGEARLSLSGRERLSRWLFYFLHSWDAPTLLRTGWWREIAMILLSVGGGIVAATGVMIGWRRLRRDRSRA